MTGSAAGGSKDRETPPLGPTFAQAPAVPPPPRVVSARRKRRDSRAALDVPPNFRYKILHQALKLISNFLKTLGKFC